MTLLEEIQNEKEKLDFELREAASFMVKNDKIKKIYAAIKQNQERCPHIANYSICPYCGKKVK